LSDDRDIHFSFITRCAENDPEQLQPQSQTEGKLSSSLNTSHENLALSVRHILKPWIHSTIYIGYTCFPRLKQHETLKLMKTSRCSGV